MVTDGLKHIIKMRVFKSGLNRYNMLKPGKSTG